MLLPMQAPAAASPTLSDASFASLLAALAAPAPKSGASGDRDAQEVVYTPLVGRDGSLPQKKKSAPAWNEDDLGDDIATLSYEQALRTHARYRPAQGEDSPLPQDEHAGPLPRQEAPARAGAASALAVSAPPAQNRAVSYESAAAKHGLATLEESRKAASITIRLSKAECAQLHERAAEAGLTVSAYLRSCAFEAESLRAQVKFALAELRSAGAKEEKRTGEEKKAGKPAASSAPSVSWWARLFPRWTSQRRTAHA